MDENKEGSDTFDAIKIVTERPSPKPLKHHRKTSLQPSSLLNPSSSSQNLEKSPGRDRRSSLNTPSFRGDVNSNRNSPLLSRLQNRFLRRSTIFGSDRSLHLKRFLNKEFLPHADHYRNRTSFAQGTQSQELMLDTIEDRN